jgi:hypothetical protein
MDFIYKSVEHALSALSYLKALVWWASESQSHIFCQHSNNLHLVDDIFNKETINNFIDVHSDGTSSTKIKHQNIWLREHKDHWHRRFYSYPPTLAIRHILYSDMYKHLLQQHPVSISPNPGRDCNDPFWVHKVVQRRQWR